jgi:hypothetical protein
MLEKARSLACEVVVPDLQDSVARLLALAGMIESRA